MQTKTISAEKARLETNYTPSKIKLYILHKIIDRNIKQAYKKGHYQCKICYLPFLLSYNTVRYFKEEEMILNNYSMNFLTDNAMFNYIIGEYIYLGYYVELYLKHFVISWKPSGNVKRSVLDTF